MKTANNLCQAYGDLRRVDPNNDFIAIFDLQDGLRDHFQKGWVLEMTQLGLRVGIIYPAVVFNISKYHIAL